MSHQHEIRPADFSERALAFAVDLAPFVAAWSVTLKLIDGAEPLFVHPKGAAAALLFGGLFLAYQAFFSSEGRVSLGKRLLGLRVVGQGERPLDLGRALARSLGYLLSQIFTAGFLWALLDPNGRALHDLLAGSLVVSDRPFQGGRRLVVRFAAGGLLAAFAAVWGWQNLWAPRYERTMTVAYAKDGLNEYVQLERAYKHRHGHYADSMFALAEVSMDPRAFLLDAAALYDQGRVAIAADKDRFTIVARANDVDKTLVAVSGP